MEGFELKLRISPPDSKFRKLIGHNTYNRLHLEELKKNRFVCGGCSYRPLDENRAIASLKLHVIEINKEKPEESPCIVLCIACHSTQHIDVSIEKGWVQLVNSNYSQRQLIDMCRLNSIHTHAKEDNLRHLKIPPLDFLLSMKDGTLSENTKSKVLFTNKFDWGDL